MIRFQARSFQAESCQAFFLCPWLRDFVLKMRIQRRQTRIIQSNLNRSGSHKFIKSNLAERGEEKSSREISSLIYQFHKPLNFQRNFFHCRGFFLPRACGNVIWLCRVAFNHVIKLTFPPYNSSRFVLLTITRSIRRMSSTLYLFLLRNDLLLSFWSSAANESRRLLIQWHALSTSILCNVKLLVEWDYSLRHLTMSAFITPERGEHCDYAQFAIIL